jgi:hypothetical protein
LQQLRFTLGARHSRSEKRRFLEIPALATREKGGAWHIRGERAVPDAQRAYVSAENILVVRLKCAVTASRAMNVATRSARG